MQGSPRRDGHPIPEEPFDIDTSASSSPSSRERPLRILVSSPKVQARQERCRRERNHDRFGHVRWAGSPTQSPPSERAPARNRVVLLGTCSARNPVAYDRVFRLVTASPPSTPSQMGLGKMACCGHRVTVFHRRTVGRPEPSILPVHDAPSRLG